LHLNYTCLEFTALYDTDYVLLATELTLNILKYNVMYCRSGGLVLTRLNNMVRSF